MKLIPVDPSYPAQFFEDYGHKDCLFLCKYKGSKFTSEISTIKADWSLKANMCNNICLYVDDINRKHIIPINDLDEMYLIEEE